MKLWSARVFSMDRRPEHPHDCSLIEHSQVAVLHCDRGCYAVAYALRYGSARALAMTATGPFNYAADRPVALHITEGESTLAERALSGQASYI